MVSYYSEALILSRLMPCCALLEPLTVAAVGGAGASIATRSAMDDLLGIDNEPVVAPSTGKGGASNVDLLNEIFGSSSAAGPLLPAAPAKPKDVGLDS